MSDGFCFNLQNCSLGTCNYGNRYGDTTIHDFLARPVRWWINGEVILRAKIIKIIVYNPCRRTRISIIMLTGKFDIKNMATFLLARKNAFKTCGCMLTGKCFELLSLRKGISCGKFKGSNLVFSIAALRGIQVFNSRWGNTLVFLQGKKYTARGTRCTAEKRGKKRAQNQCKAG